MSGDVWKSAELTKTYLTGIRGAIPQANDQIAMMLQLIRAAVPSPKRILDLGCGDGILGDVLLNEYPDAEVVFVDFSKPMLEAAQQRINQAASNATLFLPLDYGELGWDEVVGKFGRYDVIVSGFSIHHQPDARKREIYAEIYHLLANGGIFLNIEHVQSADAWIASRFDDLFIDALFNYQNQIGSDVTRESVAHGYHMRPDTAANILAPVEAQCDWL
ncbi:MAG: class I SAM-dependent methyltransferase, partial [Candidatus Promineifilaceae bacterium]